MASSGLRISSSPLAGKLHQGYLLAVVVLMIAVKLWIASDLKASAAFCDDYNYLNKSPYYIRGDLKMAGYPFENLFAGALYPLVLSPWLLWDNPEARIFVVHAINILLSGITVYFGSRAVAQLTKARSLLAPVCLASFVPVFLFSFYALTENLVFTLVAVAGWLAVDFGRTCKSKSRLALLLAVTAMLPLVRAPGMAVCPALLVLLWLNRKVFGFTRTTLLGLAVVAAAVGPYLLCAILAPSVGGSGAKRESAYLDVIVRVVRHPENLIVTAKLALSQTCYLLLSTGYWVLPVLLVMGLQIRRLEPGPERRCWVNYWMFALTTCVMFTSFCLAHLLRKLDFNPAAGGFILGRYSDPSGVLLVIGGMAAVLSIRSPTRFQGFVLRVAAPLLLCLAVNKVWGTEWATISQSGLIMLCRKPPAFPLGYLMLFLVTATLLSQLMPPTRWRAPALMVFFLVLQLVSIDRGLSGVTRPRARRIAHSLEAANWIHANLPKTAHIGYDWNVARKGAPNGWHAMYGVFRAMIFSTYPRPASMVKTTKQLQECDYLYTIAGAENPSGLQPAWSNGDYILYQLAPVVEGSWNDAKGG